MTRELALMMAILLLAFALGAGGLNLDPIWADELASVTFMGAFDPPYDPARTVASLLEYSPDQGPLYFVLGAWWARLVGFSHYALRVFSLLTGALMIASLYRFGADLLGRRTALLSALLISTSAFVTLYMHDIRMYTMWMWLVVAHHWLYWLLSQRQATRLTWLLFVLTVPLLLYTHFFSVVYLAALGLYHLVFMRASRNWLRIALGWAIGGLFFAPYLPLVVDGIRFQSRVTSDALGALEPVAPLLLLLGNGSVLLFLAPFLLLLLFWRRLRQPALTHLLFCGGIAALLILLLNANFGFITITRFRYFLCLFPAAILAIAFVLKAMPRKRVAMSLFLAAWCLIGLQVHQSGEVVEYAGLMARDRAYPPMQDYVFHLRGKTADNDYLLGFTDHFLLSEVSYNSSHSTSDYYLGAQLGIDGIFLHASKRQYRLDRDVRDITRSQPQLLLAHDPGAVPLNLAHSLSVIQETHAPCPPLVDEPRLLIVKYRQPLMACDHAATPVEYENGVRLIDRAVAFDAASDSLKALLWWSLPDESMLDDFNISLQIFGPDQSKASQSDHHLDANLVPWRVTGLATDELPSGAYSLKLILYDRLTGAKISGIDAATGEQVKFLRLADFAIESQP